jgi:phospholipase/carboxylesterase
MTVTLDSHIHLFRPGTDADPRTLLMLHGTGGDEASFADLGPILAPGAAVLSVRGNVSEHGMNRFFRRRAEGVYDMDDLAFRTRALGAFVEAALQQYEIDRDRLIGVGYSNGANILANLLFQEPSLVPAAVLMHPLIPFAPEDQPGLAGRRVLITAGEQDPICPPALTRALHGYLERQGAAAELMFHPGGHELQATELEAARRFVAVRPAAPAALPG